MTYYPLLINNYGGIFDTLRGKSATTEMLDMNENISFSYQ